MVRLPKSAAPRTGCDSSCSAGRHAGLVGDEDVYPHRARRWQSAKSRGDRGEAMIFRIMAVALALSACVEQGQKCIDLGEGRSATPHGYSTGSPSIWIEENERRACEP